MYNTNKDTNPSPGGSTKLSIQTNRFSLQTQRKTKKKMEGGEKDLEYGGRRWKMFIPDQLHDGTW